MTPEELDTLKSRVAVAEQAGRRLKRLECLVSSLRSATEIQVEVAPPNVASMISYKAEDGSPKIHSLGDEEGICEELRQAVIAVIERRCEEAEERFRDA